MTRRAFTALAALPGALPLPAAPEAGAGIRRTMRLLTSSSPSQPNTVRVLVYGQSITQQNWWKTVADSLRTRYPQSDLRVVNLAIGGYSTQFLIRTIVHDVYPFYPDLVLFHDYGRQDQYEEMIAGIRRRTTSEVLLLTDHVTWHPQFDEPDAEKAKRQEREDRHNFEWMPSLAAKYGCGLCDIRRAWYQHLEANRIPAKALLRDNVHLNEAGEKLYASIVEKALLPSEGPVEETVREVPVRWRNRATVEFEGNRLDAIAGRDAHLGATFRVLLDGKRPSEYPEMYAITRPSNTWCVDWPSINRIDSEAPLLVEDWVLRCVETEPDGSRARFHVIGSETGFDGEGVSTERFVSRSRRIVIDPSDWVFARAYSLRKIAMPRPFEVQWRVEPLFQDVWNGRTGRLLQGIANGGHRVELIADGSGQPRMTSVRVYRPPIR